MEERKTCEVGDIWDTVMPYAEKSFLYPKLERVREGGFRPDKRIVK